jgi:hypothetical protein
MPLREGRLVQRGKREMCSRKMPSNRQKQIKSILV